MRSRIHQLNAHTNARSALSDEFSIPLVDSAISRCDFDASCLRADR